MRPIDKIVAKVASQLIGHRRILALIFTLVTIGLIFSMHNIQLDPGFRKLIPVQHSYMQTMMHYRKDFPGANRLLVSLQWTGKGKIYNKQFMTDLKQATQDVFFIPGIDRTSVKSLFTPDTVFIKVTKDGFNGEPIVPSRYSGTAEQLKQVHSNVLNSGQVGILVANNHKAALIRAQLQEVDTSNPAKAAVFYQRAMSALHNLRGHFESKTKYVYTLNEGHDPVKAHGEVVLEPGDKVAVGYVDLGWKQRFHTFYYQPSGGGDAVPISGGDVSVTATHNPAYSPNVEVNIIGFAMLLSYVIQGLLGVFAFFALAFGITVLLLFFYTRSIKLTLVALFAALLPVIWLIGVLPLIGYGIDPMSILVPFLIFAIGVSHAIQMTSAWRLEMVHGASPPDAAYGAFTKLFVPGSVALLTGALGFGVIMIIKIPIIHELGITACLGVLLMIVTNKMVLPITLSYLRLGERSLAYEGSPFARKVWDKVAMFAEPRNALFVMILAALLMGFATWQSRSLIIGDTDMGTPNLQPDSRYNHDVRQISNMYSIGVNVLGVIFEAPDFQGGSCLHYSVMNDVAHFSLYMRGVAGVQSVKSNAGIGKRVIQAYNENNPLWSTLPRSSRSLSTAAPAFNPRMGFNTESCRAIQVMVFTKNHKGGTIDNVVNAVKEYRANNHVDGVNIKLATGNIGVMAATNEAVESAEARMVLYLFIALVLFCFITFRSWTGVLCVMVPLTLVTVMGNALMSMLGIGLKTATLPVVALGVGVGVDYGIYLFERIQHYMKEPGTKDFREAFRQAMQDRGSPIVLTALTMSIGVATWTMSALKYQDDMGLLLAFLFLVNMFGAIFILPSLGAWFFRQKKSDGKSGQSGTG